MNRLHCEHVHCRFAAPPTPQAIVYTSSRLCNLCQQPLTSACFVGVSEEQTADGRILCRF